MSQLAAGTGLAVGVVVDRAEVAAKEKRERGESRRSKKKRSGRRKSTRSGKRVLRVSERTGVVKPKEGKVGAGERTDIQRLRRKSEYQKNRKSRNRRS